MKKTLAFNSQKNEVIADQEEGQGTIVDMSGDSKGFRRKKRAAADRFDGSLDPLDF